MKPGFQPRRALHSSDAVKMFLPASEQRLAEGWSYGPYRDDQNKRHACLVPL